MRFKMKELIGRADDIIIEVNSNESRGEKCRNEVNNWLKEVNSAKEQVSNIEKNLKEQSRCWKGCMPNYCMRQKISKMSLKLTKDAEELIENGITMEMPPVDTLPTTTDLTRKEILKCILSKEIRIIGVHGMGGVGKTTIMGNIYNTLTEFKRYDNTIWITVSRDSDVKKLQRKIANKLEIILKEDDDDGDAQGKICNAFKCQKKFLLILDDIWEAFDLDEVGIPLPSEENGCKIVLTTRDLRVCGGMSAHPVPVKVLSDDESWELFKENVGDIILSRDIEDLAKDVTKECCHLPLAIITVAKSLFGVDDARVWKNALKDLKEANLKFKGTENVFALLKFSYAQLPDFVHQSCFLYCALYPEDYNISADELIEYWICEGLISEKGTREDNMNKGHIILDELIKVSMLERCKGYDINDLHVKMHELIRDMAIGITREGNPRSSIHAGAQLRESSFDQWPEDAERISLMQNDIEELLGQPKCSKLLTLFLQQNPLEIVPDSYFNCMCLIKVLDLSRTKLKSLPESVSKLKNLRALSLRNCLSLEEVPSLSELEELRVLDLSGTKITELPRGMEAMVKLQRLNLDWTAELRVFSAGMIHRLFLLEELTMQCSRWRWSSTTTTTTTKEAVGTEEIIHSTRLTTLKIDFTDLCSFLHYVSINSDKLQMMKSFLLSVGSSDILGNFRKFVVEINGCDLIDGENSLLLPSNTQRLYISNCEIRSLWYFTRLLNNNELFCCNIEACNEMEFLMADEEPLLPYLKELSICHVSDLLALCKGISSPDALKSLESLTVYNCFNLKYLLPMRLLQQLRRLKHICVIGCRSMEEIIAEEKEMDIAIDEDNNTMTLPQLQNLKMEDLPKLEGICSRALICDALETITIAECSQLKKLPFSIHNLPCALKEIKVDSEEWWDALEWDDPQTMAHFKRSKLRDNPLQMIPDSYFNQMCLLNALDLSRTNLKSLPESVSKLKNLHALKLRGCQYLKEVSSLSELEKLRVLDLSGTKITELPPGVEAMVKLQCLNLSWTKIKLLPDSISNLKNLLELSLRNCLSLEEVPSLSELEELRVLDLSGTKITELPRGMEAMVKLQRLNLDWTAELRVFSAGMIHRLFLLEELTMQCSRWRWSSTTTTTKEGAGTEEIINSIRLTTLKIDFRDLCSFLHYVKNSGRLQMMKRFHLSVGRSILRTNSHESTVEIEGCDLIDEENTLMLPNNTQRLHIRFCQIRSLWHLRRSLDKSKLCHCSIYDCDKVEFLIMADEEPVLPYLKELSIDYISDILVLCKGIPSPDTLKSLEFLQVCDCPKLKYLLPARLLQQLRRLKRIEVKLCDEMKEIIGEEEEMEMALNEDNYITMTLPQLKSLEMSSLPKLEGICSRTLICNALETITIEECPQLKKLPFSVHNLPRALKVTKYTRNNEWDALEWDDQQTKDHFKPIITDYY